LLLKADSVKTSSPAEFREIVSSLGGQFEKLPKSQQQYLRYLQAWQTAYDGDYDTAIAALRDLIDESDDVVHRFRAQATIANLQALASRFENAFAELSQLLPLLNEVKDVGAREQALGVAAQLYNQVGEYDLALTYAEKLVAENLNTRSACRGGQMKLEALYKSRGVTRIGPEFQSAIDVCERFGETSYANVIRTYMARLHIDQGRYDDAIKILTDHYNQVMQARYPRLISQYDALLAQSYRQIGNVAQARQYADRSIEHGANNEYTESRVAAYHLLYVLAKERDDVKSALAYHEKYAASDKGYLDDVSAKQLAYNRVKHEVDAGKLQIDALNKQNQVLQLQRQLSDKAIENIRLYIALLAAILIFIALWAYRTKRSQMHFMKLSRRDGLTGIFNRPHFIELAEITLVSARKTDQAVCVVLCDLDHFKLVNDNYGHAEGDYVLQRAVAACQRHLRSTDVFARIGGEEFGLLLPGCTLADARVRVERLRVAVSESNLAEGKFKVSASFGIAVSSASGYELQTLMTHADAALYQAKRSGRNCVVAYQSGNVEVIAPRIAGAIGASVS